MSKRMSSKIEVSRELLVVANVCVMRTHDLLVGQMKSTDHKEEYREEIARLKDAHEKIKLAFLAAPVGEHQPMPQKYDDTLLPFVALMRKELHSNGDKGDRPGWLAMSADTCMLEIIYHFGKLQASVKRGDGDGINEYAADVANMCMMLTDICGSLAYAEITAPPELAELQATIARLTAENDQLKSENDEPEWHQMITRLEEQNTVLRAEIERLKGGQGEPVADGRWMPKKPTPEMVAKTDLGAVLGTIMCQAIYSALPRSPRRYRL